jgi:hypothetical protein
VRAAGLLIVLIALSAVACADDGGEAQPQPQPEPQPQRALVECDGPPVASNLPADFPRIAGVTYTKSTSAGRSTLVDGYYVGRLEGAYTKFKNRLRAAGYFVIFDEIEAADSEVAYSGGKEGTNGIVALRENCKQNGRISVHVTNRPD